jgi:hypothetical protein
MNAVDIIKQIRAMKGLMPEVNRATIAVRFRELIANTVKGVGVEAVQHWASEGAPGFIKACELEAPPTPINIDSTNMGGLSSFIDKWEAVDTWRVPDTDDEWAHMSQESFNIKATILRDLRRILDDSRP